jgi:NTP pyrophosphatase (non-canonical NTP hydrolase)
VTLHEYQQASQATVAYPDMGHNLIYPALGIGGEAGEVVDKIKKLWRNRGVTDGALLTLEERLAVLHELGDVLWYIAALAAELGASLDDVASLNIKKLEDRAQRGVIKSEGDTR